MVDLRHVFTLLKELKDLSLVGLVAGMTRINCFAIVANSSSWFSFLHAFSKSCSKVDYILYPAWLVEAIFEASHNQVDGCVGYGDSVVVYG